MVKTWKLTNEYFLSVFVETEEAQPDIYIILPSKSSESTAYWWILLAAA